MMDDREMLKRLLKLKTENNLQMRLYAFARESNEIERIYLDERHEKHREALIWFLDLRKITIKSLDKFVKCIEPTAFLRTKPDHRVFIGGHEAPRSYVSQRMLKKLLTAVNNGKITSHEAHCQYEMIHPFIDGNGRSGRALWLWMMKKKGYDLQFLFLQAFYYQTLSQYVKNK